MRTDELDYDFDPSLVATTPAEPRDAARLMVIRRARGTIEHRTVRDLAEILGAGDELVVNATSVLRARLGLVDEARGRETEGLLLEPSAEAPLWRVLVRQAKRFDAGTRLALRDGHGRNHGDAIELVRRDDEAWLARVVPGPLGGDLGAVLERSGQTPLPPYILKARRDQRIEVDDDLDRAEYETVYAKASARGSVAAPTAGLHFTDALLAALAARGVGRHELILDVGAGTFKPVESDTLEAHDMHAERFMVPREVLAMLADAARARAAGSRRIVAVGTTTVRALESLPDPLPAADRDFDAITRILISPGFRWRFTDALMTNFHLPRSTLLALVGSFCGMELMREAYATAVRERYRFYSYGDAMLILP
ncbi:MAG: tRNA preQ1(34) S-adenosylmethionine ribosyltransferase-isomerase QueA [Phycisphaera sp.]|nr:tRNA preQ1(34) S-adenosylmethionine ribosyltransferase-isomerase QueA [Phycisphaera sp.]